MTIREMTASDVPKVAEIERQTFSLPWSAQSLRDAVRDANALFFVAAEQAADGAELVAGYLGLYLSPPEAEIANVAVAESFRRGGVGTALLAAAQEAAGDCGVTQIFLEVRCGNAPAICLYEKMGFAEVGLRRGFYDCPREDAMIMRWDRV